MEHGKSDMSKWCLSQKMDWFESVILFKDTHYFKASQQIEIMHEGMCLRIFASSLQVGSPKYMAPSRPRPDRQRPQIHSIINSLTHPNF